jgi:hypothetical protein
MMWVEIIRPSRWVGGGFASSGSVLAILVTGILALLALAAPVLAAAPVKPAIAPASEVTNTSAVLHGVVNPGVKPEEATSVSWFFEYNKGAVCTGGATTEVKGPFPVAAESTAVAVSELGGVALKPATQYTFCLVVQKEGEGEAVSEPESFTTTALPPVIRSEFSSNVGSNTATLNARIEPLGGTSTTVSVEYGESSSYGFTLPAIPLGSFEKQGEAFPLTGLLPATTYHYQLIVTDSLGTTRGKDQAFTTFPAAGPFKLSDGRSYVQVSPVLKNGAAAIGRVGNVVSSPVGDRVTFVGLDGFPGITGLSEYPTYMSSFSDEAWSTQSLVPAGPLREVTIKGYSPDLRYAVIETDGVLAPGATAGNDNFYLYDTVAHTYTIIGVREPGEESQAALHLADGKPGCGCLLFETRRRLLPTATPEVPNPEVPNLYVWRNGTLTLVDEEHRPEGISAGPLGGARISSYTQNTLSEDGTRVTFSDEQTRQILMRIGTAAPITVSAPEEGAPGQPEVEPTATWRAETPDGRYVFFSSEARLTVDAKATPGHPDLYRFDADARHLEDITTGTPEGANLIGTLGVSDDGSYAYLVATEALAPGAIVGQNNLYVWHSGTTSLVATLETNDADDWREQSTTNPGPSGGQRASRVNPAGTDAIFISRNALTGYDTAAQPEIYHFDYPTRSLVCVSCNPTRERASSATFLALSADKNGPQPLEQVLARNLTADGRNVFFSSEEALVPEDTNGRMDVYEWTQEGIGGSIHLISTGRSQEQSYFGDASANGSDVFFFTAESLVGQDTDSIPDVYDARIGPGIPSQNPPTGPPPCGGADCGALGSPNLTGPAQSSATLTGTGNLIPEPPPHRLKPPTVAQLRAKALAKALESCRRKHNAHRRRVCEAQAHQRPSAKQAAGQSPATGGRGNAR